MAENQNLYLKGDLVNYNPEPGYETEFIKEGLGNTTISQIEGVDRKINISKFTVNNGTFTLDKGVVLDSGFSLGGENASLVMNENAGINNVIDIYNGDLTIFNEKNISSAAGINFHSITTTPKLHTTSNTVISNDTIASSINIAKNIEFVTEATTTEFNFQAGADSVIVKSGKGTFVADNNNNNFEIKDLTINDGIFKLENTQLEVFGTTAIDKGTLLVSGENSKFKFNDGVAAADRKIVVHDGSGIGIYDDNSIA